MQWGIRYLGSDQRIQTLKPDQAREYQVTSQHGTVQMVSCSNLPDAAKTGFRPADRIFLRVMADGRVRLLKYYEYDGYLEHPESPDPVMREAPGSLEVYLLRRVDGQLVFLRPGFLCEDLKEHLSDCPGLAEMMDPFKCKNINPVSVVEAYNNTCSR